MTEHDMGFVNDVPDYGIVEMTNIDNPPPIYDEVRVVEWEEDGYSGYEEI